MRCIPFLKRTDLYEFFSKYKAPYCYLNNIKKWNFQCRHWKSTKQLPHLMSTIWHYNKEPKVKLYSLSLLITLLPLFSLVCMNLWDRHFSTRHLTTAHFEQAGCPSLSLIIHFWASVQQPHSCSYQQLHAELLKLFLASAETWRKLDKPRSCFLRWGMGCSLVRSYFQSIHAQLHH